MREYLEQPDEKQPAGKPQFFRVHPAAAVEHDLGQLRSGQMVYLGWAVLL